MKQEPKSLIVIEKDDKLFKNLKKVYTNNKLVKVLNKDILKFNVETIVKKNSLIIGNLPYNISSQILVKILKFKKWPPNYMDIIFMFQKELGKKLWVNI